MLILRTGQCMQLVISQILEEVHKHRLERSQGFDYDDEDTLLVRTDIRISNFRSQYFPLKIR